MPLPHPDFSPAVRDGVEQLRAELAQWGRKPAPITPPGSGYRMVIAAWNGCGKMHDFAALQKATAKGISLFYVDSDGSDSAIINPPPGKPWRGAGGQTNWAEASRMLASVGLTSWDERVALVGPNGKVVAYLDSDAPDFLAKLQRHTAAKAPAKQSRGGI